MSSKASAEIRRLYTPTTIASEGLDTIAWSWTYPAPHILSMIETLDAVLDDATLGNSMPTCLPHTVVDVHQIETMIKVIYRRKVISLGNAYFASWPESDQTWEAVKEYDDIAKMKLSEILAVFHSDFYRGRESTFLYNVCQHFDVAFPFQIGKLDGVIDAVSEESSEDEPC